MAEGTTGDRWRAVFAPLLWVAILAACADSPILAPTLRDLAVPPEIVDFGSAAVGEGVERTIELRNTGDTLVEFDGPSIMESQAFRVLELDDDQRDVRIRLQMEPLMEGPQIGWLIIPNDSVSYPNLGIELRGGGAQAADCDDGEACTLDSFDPNADICIHAAQSGGCDDGSACTTNDSCIDGVCVGVGVTCNDGVGCTVDLCDSNWGCEFVPDDSYCDDDDPCTENLCSAVEGCSRIELPNGTVCGGPHCSTISLCGQGACSTYTLPQFGEPDPLCPDRRVCNEHGWCWQYPQPQGEDLVGVWVAPDGEVWALGERVVLHWDGAAWSGADLGDARGAAIWGASSSDVWLAGRDSTLLHWNGENWSPAAVGLEGEYRALWGTAQDDVWVVGDNGTVLHWDGDGWSTEITPITADLLAVAGCPSGEIWVAGTDGLVERLVAGVWESLPTDLAHDLHTVWCSGPNDVWVAGGLSAGAAQDCTSDCADGIWRWNGISWNRRASETIHALWGDGTNVWAVGLGDAVLRWNGGWSRSYLEGVVGLRGVWGNADGDVWAVGTSGTTYRLDGASWERQTFFVGGGFGPYDDIFSIWGSSSDDVWAVGQTSSEEALVLHWNGVQWARITAANDDVFAGARGLGGVAGSAADNVWAVGAADEDMFHFDGVSWTRKPRPYAYGCSRPASLPPTIYGPYQLWVGGYDDAWWPQYEAVLRWDGQSWSCPGFPVTNAWGTSPDDVWLFGDWICIRWDGATATLCPTDTPRIYFGAVWGSGPDDIWMFKDTQLHRWDGNVWEEIFPQSQQWPGDSIPRFRSMWGTGPGDVWAAGEDGLTAHWDGAEWRVVPSVTHTDLNAVWAGSNGRAWAVAEGGAVLTYAE